MAISFPHQVTFQNARLQTLSLFLHLVCGILIVYQFMHFGHYHKNIQLGGSVQLQPAYNTTVFHTSVSGGPQAACDSPQLFDHWRDSEGIHSYGNHSCIPICGPGFSGPCVKDTHVIFSDGPHTLFVATQIQDKIKLNSTVRNYFVSSAETTRMHLTVDFNWPEMPWFVSGTTPARWEKHSSSKDVHIRILNKDGQQMKSFAPGSPIILSVAEIMNLAGVDSLDTGEPLAGANHMPAVSAVVAAAPSRRLVGMQLEINVDCGGSSGEKRDCRLRAFVQPGTWISASTLCNLFVGDSIYRTCHGLRIRAAFVGARRMVDVNSLFINLCSSVVFFQLPRAIVLVTALYLCGHLSTVYRNVVHNHFSITKEAGAMAMRLLQHELTFNRLESETKNGALSGNISKVDIGCSLRHIVERRRCLDDTEIKNMTEFALTVVTREFENPGAFEDGGIYSAFMTAFCQGLDNFWASLKESFGILKPRTDHDNLHVDVDTFVAACSSSEPISFNNLVKLFDGDRTVSLMEQFFMPILFKTSLAEMRTYTHNQGKAEFGHRKSNSMTSLQHEVDVDHDMVQNVVEEVSEERRLLDIMAEKINALSLRLDEQQHNYDSELSEDRRKRDTMTEHINALALRLDEQERNHKFAQSQASQEGCWESGARTMTKQSSAHTLRLEEQQRKLAFEQFQARREIDELKEQQDQLVQALTSLQVLGLQALEKERTGSSSTSMPDVEQCNHKPKEQLLTADALSEPHQEAEDFTCLALPRENNTMADSHEMRVRAAGFLLKEANKKRQLSAPPIAYDQESKEEGEASAIEGQVPISA